MVTWRRLRPPVVGDVGMAVLTFALGVVVIAVGISVTGWAGVVPGGVSRWWHLLPLAVGCAVMLGKRAHPVGALAAGVAAFAVDVAIGGSTGTVLVLWDLLYTAARIGSAPTATWLRRVTVGLVPAGAVVALSAGGSLTDAVIVAIAVFAVLVTPVWWGLDVRRESELAAVVAANARLDRDRALADERARMARDLHDAVAGDLSSIAIHAEAALAHGVDPAAPEGRALRAIRDAGVHAMGEMTTMITLLRREGPADDDTTAPGLADLPALLDRARADGLTLRPDVAPGETALTPGADAAAYRIVQEALTNARRHCPGGTVDLAVRPGETGLQVSVTSHGGPGPPSRAEPSTGLGLASMRERAEALGGRFTAGWVDGAPTPTWRVRAVLPGGSR